MKRKFDQLAEDIFVALYAEDQELGPSPPKAPAKDWFVCVVSGMIDRYLAARSTPFICDGCRHKVPLEKGYANHNNPHCKAHLISKPSQFPDLDELERLLGKYGKIGIRDLMLRLERTEMALEMYEPPLKKCCPNEERTFAGGCRHCGDPSF